MTPQTPAEQQKWALTIRKPGTGSSMTIYKYASEEAARADIAKWAQHPAYKEYSEHQIAPESADRPLLSEREAGR